MRQRYNRRMRQERGARRVLSGKLCVCVCGGGFKRTINYLC